MLLGCIGDDFTGSSDLANTLSKQGMRCVQFTGVPSAPAGQDVEAGVIALKSRSIDPQEAVRQSLEALSWLQDQGCEQFFFKYCSTFDSTPHGNIGPVADALAEALDAHKVIVCPAFPGTGRSVYQGHLFVFDRLLSESGMQDHPLTPMKDPDLRRVLAAQTKRNIGHIPAMTVASGAAAISDVMAQSTGHVIVDAIHNADLMAIGKASKDLPLLCGGSGIALGLPANFGATPATPHWAGISGPGVVISGSCSRATRAQVAAYKTLAPSFEIAAADVIDGTVTAASIADWVMDQTGAPLVYSSADPDVVRAAQIQFGTTRAAHAIEALFADLAATLAQRGVTRIVVAGGETSGAVVSGLGAQTLEIGPRLAAGVPVVRVAGAAPLCLALKSGNFGGPDFFAEALTRMETPT